MACSFELFVKLLVHTQQGARDQSAGAEAQQCERRSNFDQKTCPPEAPVLPIDRNEKFGTFSF
jgi:hypothetical protein